MITRDEILYMEKIYANELIFCMLQIQRKLIDEINISEECVKRKKTTCKLQEM